MSTNLKVIDLGSNSVRLRITKILDDGQTELLIGAIPFYIGDVLDVFKRSYVENLRLVTGYIEDDKEIINKVNKKL